MTLEPHVRRHQRIRLQRLAMASASYAVMLIIAAVTAALGAVRWHVAGVYALCIAAIVAGFYLIFRSHLNLRCREPNLTFVQVIVPMLPSLYLIYNIESPQARAGILFLVIVPLLFGMLGLTRRGLLVAALCYFAGNSGMFLVLMCRQPVLAHAPGQWVVLTALTLLLIQIALIGGFISQLRQTLRQKNRELGAALQRISDLAAHDELTGLFNRRHMLEVLQFEGDRAARGEAIFSVCMLDIDHFKSINDRYGHAVGDQVLIRVATTIDGAMRAVDTVGRYGGEEFVLILPMIGVDAACIAADRLRGVIEALVFVGGDSASFSVTVSIGVAASTRESATRTETILNRADHALYRAKAAGRNCVRKRVETD